MIIVPIQRWGIGDIIYEQTVVRKVANGNSILWPVEPHFVDGLSRAYPDITFSDGSKMDIDFERRDDYVQNAMRFLPLRWADSIMKVPYTACMASKYSLYHQDYRIWKERAMWHRDTVKEDELFEVLGCNNGPYNLINRFFGSDSQLQVTINVNNECQNIEMKTIQGFSLFDYAKVMENADNLHLVSSSTIYLTEQLELKAKEVHLYCRRPIEYNFANIDYLLEKHKYVFHL